jgi:CBS domain-containing protein
MTTSQIEVKTRVTELATQAFKAFCEEISGTFGVDTECEQREILTETIGGLQKRFKKLVAVNTIESEGLLNGTFQFIFDRKGLFTLGGIINMQPAEMIMSNIQKASAGLAKSMVDAMGEIGNLLVGSWDRCFSKCGSRTAPTGHNHFSHRLPAFVGKPWNKSEETFGLTGDEEVFLIPYEMTMGSYPVFNCGVILPKKIFAGSSDFVPVEVNMTKETTQEKNEESPQNMQAATEKTNSKKSREVKKSKSKKPKPNMPTAKKASAEVTDPGKITEKTEVEETEKVKKSESKKSEQIEPTAKKESVEITDPGNITEKAEAEETEKVKKSKSKKSKPNKPTAEKASAEIADAEEITEKARDRKTETDKGDSEQTPAVKKSKSKKTLSRKPDTSHEQKEAAKDAKGAYGITEDETTTRTSDDSEMGEVSEAIRKLAQSSALPDKPGNSDISNEDVSSIATSTDLTGQSEMAKMGHRVGYPTVDATPGVIGNIYEICANDIMQNQVTWASPDDSLQQAFAKMQQTDAGYIMIGRNGVIEGIVSKSDTTRAMSPYLQPIFAKWRRPLDDATLKIRIKWIMSRPVRTIKPETSLAAIMEHMSQFRGRCLPVTDEQGNVQGLVTAFDIFRALLKNYSNTCPEGQTARALVESASPAGTI